MEKNDKINVFSHQYTGYDVNNHKNDLEQHKNTHKIPSTQIGLHGHILPSVLGVN